MKTLDPRVILASGVEDETLTLKLSTLHPFIFEYLWSTFGLEVFSFDSHLVPLLSYLAQAKDFNRIQEIY